MSHYSEKVETVKHYLMQLQSRICESLETLEPEKRFAEDKWQRQQGGGGKIRIIEGGTVLEKGGVAFSHVTGTELPRQAQRHTDQNLPEPNGRQWAFLW